MMATGTWQRTMDWECVQGCDDDASCTDPDTDCLLPEAEWTYNEWSYRMEYTTFHVGPPDAWRFEHPCGMTCDSTNATWNASQWITDPCVWETPCECEGFNSCPQTQCFPEDGSGPVDCMEPPMPILPPQFEATIEATLSEQNLTVHMHEWFDIPNNRARTDFYNARWGTAGMRRTVYDISNNIYWHMTPEGCTHGDMEHVDRGWGTGVAGVVEGDDDDDDDDDANGGGGGGWGSADSGPHHTAPTEAFHFGGDLNETRRFDRRHST